jgi:hypothetical protein
MFERVVLSKSLVGPAITVGEIAEALLFYQNIHIGKRAFTAVLTIILRSDPHSRAGVLSPGLSANQLER